MSDTTQKQRNLRRLIVEHRAFFAYLLLKQVLTEGCSQHRLMGAWSRNHSSGTVIVSSRFLQRLGHSRHVHCRSAQRGLRHKPPCDKIGAQVAKAISLMRTLVDSVAANSRAQPYRGRG
jgi:hypothetical protein